MAFRFISLCAVLLPATVIYLPFSEDKTLRRDAHPETAIMQSDCIAVALREASAPDNGDTIYTCTFVGSSAELKHRHYLEEMKPNERVLISQEQRGLYENYPLDVCRNQVNQEICTLFMNSEKDYLMSTILNLHLIITSPLFIKSAGENHLSWLRGQNVFTEA